MVYPDLMAHDRDRRIPKTPPSEVMAQAAPLVEQHLHEDWDGEVTPLPVEPRSALASVDRRIKMSGIATLDRVDLFRAEVSGEVRAVDAKVDFMAARVAQIGELTAAIRGQLDLILQDRLMDRREVSAVRVETVMTDLEIRKSQALAQVSDASAAKALRRKIVFRLVIGLIGGVGAVWGLIATLILAGHC